MQTEEATRRDRHQLEILSLDECLQRIDEMPLGRIGFVLGGQPFILPVNHVRRGMSVAFRSAPGAKLDAARRVAQVAFEVDSFDPVTRSGWSVLGVGQAALADTIEVSHLEASPLAPWADGVPRSHWVVVKLRHVTGRRVSPPLPPHTSKDQEDDHED